MSPPRNGAPRAGLLILVAVFSLLCLLFGSTAGAQTSAAAAAVADDGLGAGDAVRISVYQSPDLPLDARISEASLVSHPLLGNLSIGAQSVGGAEKLIAEGLKNGNFMRAPQVSLLVTQVRGNQASVLGQVNRPGRFPIETTNRWLPDLLALAGGVAVGGADTVVLVGTRGSQRLRKEIELPGLFRSASGEDDLLALNGDAISVERAPIVYSDGEVQRLGPMRLERGLTVLQALATGFGLTQRGTEKGLRLHRRGADGKVLILQPTMDDALGDGDVVFVRESLF